MDSIDRRWWLFHLFGGLEQLRSATLSGWQFEIQSLSTEAPDHHGAMMDAPEWFRNGEMRN